MKKFRTPIAQLSYYKKDSILSIQVTENAEMNPENTAKHYELIMEITAGGKYLALVDASHYFYLTKEAFGIATSINV